MKQLYTGTLYWPTTVRDAPAYPSVSSDLKVKAAIVGGGMTGVICGYTLASCGIETAVLERGDIAGGSTSANTGLLQFLNDIMLCDLIVQIGETKAVRFYRNCKTAVEQLADIAESLPGDVGFKRRSSLYFASSEQDLPKLRQEYETLRVHGFDVDYWEADDIARRFPFSRPGAIVTRGDAEVNPYRFVHSLATAAAAAGAKLFERTDIVQHETDPQGVQRLTTADGFLIEADIVIFAVGYEPEELKGHLVKSSLSRSFVVVTEPQADLAPWHEKFLIWETARPYLYMRTTADGRVIAGGLDEEDQQPIRGSRSRERRTDKLKERIAALFPSFDTTVEYEWSATFGESRDNLPFIGEDPYRKGVYYCLGYGGNGSVYSAIGARLLRDLILGRDNPLADILRLDRPTLRQV